MIHGWRAGRRGWRRNRIGSALAAVALLALGSCAPGLPPPGTPDTRPRPGYENLADDLRAADAEALAGRRVALDPGHGGFFRGALGVDGLTEAEVNLGVALYLRGLLEARGAVVYMTRTDDRDFLTPADSSLRADLAERTRLANAFAPDLFVSIHHNADAGGAHDVNETQTYYKLGDEGPSLDAAQSVHRYLVRNLAIDANRVLPGNYYVLRSSNAPALLTESSYITNPDVEKKLALAAKQRLEAEALLLGIADYFARRAPEIVEFGIVAVTTSGASAGSDAPAAGRAETAPIVREFAVTERPQLGDPPAAPGRWGAGGEPRFQARIRGAWDHAEIAVDGVPLPLVRRGERIEATPAPLPPGEHVVVVSARLSGRGATRALTRRFVVGRPIDPERVTVAAWPAAWSTGDAAIGVRVGLHDAHGFPVLDSTQVRFRAERGLAPAETTAIARDGAAWAYFRPGGGGGERGLSTVAAEIAGSRSPITTRIGLGPASGRPWKRALFLLGHPGDTALVRAPGTREPLSPAAWVNRDGFALVPLDSAGNPDPPAFPGYRRVAADAGAAPVRWAAIAGGALHGRRIVLDPEGGGHDPAGVGREGTRAAHLNLEVARALEGMLAAAGAEVLLTRRGDLALSEVERVQTSEDFRAERFLRIGHRAASPRVGYYFSSAAGRRWAGAAAQALGRLGLGEPPLAEDAQYPLQQTSCPALFVSPARIDAPATEARLLAPGALRAEAYALFLALAREWAGEAVWPADSIEVRDEAGAPVPGAAVRLGGALVLETDAFGRARFARTEPGPMLVEIQHPRASRRLHLLESGSGIVTTGSRSP